MKNAGRRCECFVAADKLLLSTITRTTDSSRLCDVIGKGMFERSLHEKKNHAAIQQKVVAGTHALSNMHRFHPYFRNWIVLASTTRGSGSATVS